MVFCMLATAVPAYAASAPTFSIEANKTTANPGDTITYTLYLQQPDTITAFGANIVVPAGLTFVADSGALTSTAAEKFGATLEFTKEELLLSWYSGSGDDFTDTSKIALMTFKCKVDDGATLNQEYEVTLKNVEMAAGSAQSYAPITDTVAVTSARVEVKEKPTAVTGVTIAETLSVKVGDKATPTFNVLPANATNKAVTFKSSDTTVATVNQTTGEVTGVKAGTATITVKTVDGGFTDTCVVTVGCSHANVKDMPAQVGTCKNAGNDAYKVCNACGQLFNTSGAEINAIPTTGKDMNNHTGTAKWTKTATQHTKAYDCCGTPVVAKENHHWSDGKCSECEYSCTHSGGTATCKAAKICQYCGESYGSVNANNHTGTAKWTKTATQHTKAYDCCGKPVVATEGHHWSNGKCSECSYVCQHSGGTATCTKKAVCDECGKSYGNVDPDNHNWNTTWKSDSSGHWHTCKNGCTVKNSFAAHTPDHAGGASDEYAVKCTVCSYVIHKQLNHTHVFDKEVKSAEYKAADATCMKGTTYYKSCKCGEASTKATFVDTDVNPDNHKWATTLTNGDTTHWYACQNGCTAKKGEVAHTYGTDWETDRNNHWNECVCGDKANVAPHVDDDENKECDVCLYKYRVSSGGHSVHFDSDANGACDVCNMAMAACEHADADNNGLCDSCGSKTVESGKTFDAGIAAYGVMAVLAATGSAVIIGKKRK